MSGGCLCLIRVCGKGPWLLATKHTEPQTPHPTAQRGAVEGAGVDRRCVYSSTDAASSAVPSSRYLQSVPRQGYWPWAVSALCELDHHD